MGETATQATVCVEADCPEPGRWRPIVHVFTEKGARVPGEAFIKDLLVCQTHKDCATQVLMANDDLWQGLLSVFGGRGKIDRAKTVVYFEEVHG